jgi:hypothetical protein
VITSITTGSVDAGAAADVGTLPAFGPHMDVRFSWVKGHNGDVGNEIADKLALAGRLSLRSV